LQNPGVKPQVVVIRRQNRWHAIMHAAHCFIGRRRQNCAGLDECPIRRSQLLPQPRESEGLTVADLEAVGLFACGCALVWAYGLLARSWFLAKAIEL
jgi:hypothetical protein